MYPVFKVYTEVSIIKLNVTIIFKIKRWHKPVAINSSLWLDGKLK